ncbi:MAG TPA: FG-GAP repeat protein, partial [Acidobacteriota bacterium]|nr:FG-GAP repeat protein [Acidobacteriota bacterium]
LFRLVLPVMLALVLICELAGAAVHADFNGDGYDDLVIGVTGEQLGNSTHAGAIHVVYGGSDPNNLLNQFWHQNTVDILDSASASEQFGKALATGDFNDDGYDDLAVGVPGDDWVNPLLFTFRDKAGGVNVFYGSSNGITSANNQFWTQNSQGILDDVETEDQFGSALAAGDFDDDGFDDLAIGVPYEDINGVNNAGAVNVLYGSTNGLSPAGDQFWHQDSNGVLSDAATGDNFGNALAVGDFDNDGFADLAIAVGGEDVNNEENSGAVNILFGSSEGLAAANDQFLDGNNLIGDSSEYDVFGATLAAGNFNGDAYDDLAIGIPYKNFGNVSNAGAALVLYGSSFGLLPAVNQLWAQDNTGLPDHHDDSFGSREKDDTFGWALTAGDFNGDTIDDLAIGVRSEDYLRGSFPVIDTGAVNVIYGSPNGLTASGKQFWNQDNDGITDVGLDSDWYGAALASGDYNDDGYTDLAIGTPFKDVIGNDFEKRYNAGQVYIRFGSPNGICESNTSGCLYGKIISQEILQNPEPGDSLGMTLD